MSLSPRIRRRVQRDFPEPGSGAEVERQLVDTVGSLGLSHWDEQALERLHAAILLGAQGDHVGVKRMSELVRTDWRDALVAADLADQDWHQRLDVELGSG
jgi:hypothetical protein